MGSEGESAHSGLPECGGASILAASSSATSKMLKPISLTLGMRTKFPVMNGDVQTRALTPISMISLP